MTDDSMALIELLQKTDDADFLKSVAELTLERLWRSMNYACVYLNAFETGSEARAGIGRWIGHDNAERPHPAQGGSTPDEAHAGIPDGIGLAA